MRTKGATSCVYVKLSDLNKMFGPDALIPINRQFANQNMVTGRAMYATDENLKSAGNQPAVQEVIAVRELKDEEPEE